MKNNDIAIRSAELKDLDRLLEIEQLCFPVDRLSRRSFRHWLQSEQGLLLVAEQSDKILGYGLVWCLKGTRLARLYSLAVSPEARGLGLAHRLLTALEHEAAEFGRLFMRLEVASNNTAAIRLYENNGYRVFGQYTDYYQDHDDALRMQKTIQSVSALKNIRPTPWYQQTTEFTCGPASLMMAMNSLEPDLVINQALEMELWREATTIFMTSGHGGCHPIGLANAAQRRGFKASVYINSDAPLFLSGVRSANKKNILSLVHQQFVTNAEELGVDLNYGDINQNQLQQWLQQGCAVVILISTYQLDGKKAPHWVTLTAMDQHCLYVHDPDLEDHNQRAIDCQHLPIARADFERMSVFGSERLRTAIVISRD